MKILFAPIIIFCLFISCEKELITDVQVSPKLCFNCILNPDSIIKGSLSVSKSISNNGSIEKINNAVIRIMKDGIEIGVMQNFENGNFKLDIPPVSGSIYMVSVDAEGFPNLTASTLVPLKPAISYSLENLVLQNPGTVNATYTYTIKKNIFDHKGINRYWHYRTNITPSKKVVFSPTFRDIDSPYVDDFNKENDATDQYGFHYQYYLRINDWEMDGDTISFYSSAFQNQTNYFMDTDEHYDKYLKSIIKQKMNNGDNLLFNEPVQIYSNIENGLGIFGSAAITSFKL
jgi:hypothetical protein